MNTFNMYTTNISMDELQLTAEFRQNGGFKYIVKIELKLELKLLKLPSFVELNELENIEMTTLEINQIIAS